MMRYQENFPSLLKGFRLETLENDPNPIYGLSVALRLNYLNPGWFEFAKENDGEPAISERFPLGAFIGQAIAGAARSYYLGAYHDILQAAQVWRHGYECSSPEKFRVFRQSVYPLYDRSGLIVVNSLVREEPHDPNSRKPTPAIDKLYTQQTGFITQCSNCRRIQRATEPEAWDWVPEWIRQRPANASHTFCQLCFEYYYDFKYPATRRQPSR